MKEMGAPIEYNPNKQSYYYKRQGVVKISFVTNLTDIEKQNTIAGCISDKFLIFLQSPIISDW